MPDWNERVDAEIDAYLHWLHELEDKAVAQQRLHSSKWYWGQLMSIYTRSSLSSSGLYGKRVIALSTIEVHEEHRGKGLFTELLARITRESASFAASHLVVESVANPRLLEHLHRQGFVPVAAIDTGCPSVARTLGLQARPATMAP